MTSLGQETVKFVGEAPTESYLRATVTDHTTHTMPLTTPAPSPTPEHIRRIDELFAAHGATLIRGAHALTQNRTDAEDLVQETFVRALRRPEVFDGRTNAEALGWLWIVMRRLWRDRLRSSASRTGLLSPEAEERLIDEAPEIPEQVMRDWQMAVVAEGMARLGPRHRTAMVLLGRGHTEIESAQIAGVTRRTMREWRRDARRALGLFGERLDDGQICDLMERHLSVYADNELPEGKHRTHLEAHLAHCAHCRQSLERTRRQVTHLAAALPVLVISHPALDAHLNDAPLHLGDGFAITGPPRVVIGGHEGLVPYIEAHWRLVASTAILALSGWALIAQAFTGPHSTHLHAPPPVTHIARTTSTHPRQRLRHHVAPPTRVQLTPAPITSTPIRTALAPSTSATTNCTSAACLFGP